MEGVSSSGSLLGVVADSEDTAARLKLGTHRVEEYDGVRYAVPDFTKAMAADLEFRQLPAVEPPADVIFPWFTPGSEPCRQFFSDRKVVERYMEDGSRFLSVTSNIIEATSKVKTRPGFAGAKAKRFDILSLLTDQSLVDKFSIHGRFRMEVRNLAAVDSARAARRLQDHVRKYEGYDRVEVIVGAFGTSWKAARESLKAIASKFPTVSVTSQALFIGPKIFIYGPGGEDDWRVFGPESVAPLVRMVHKMVMATSCDSVSFLLGMELTILDIDVHDGEEVLCPVRQRHAGPHDGPPTPSSPMVSAMLSWEQRSKLDELARACETLSVDGVPSATAVRVSSQHVLVNSHVVVGDAGLTVGGHEVTPLRLLSRDLWVAALPGPEVAWHLRDPEAGERVLICYRHAGQLVYGGPVELLTVSADIITLAKDDEHMRPGVSGAAVVALRDFALLGVYDGVSLRRGLAATFTTQMFADICAYDTAIVDSRASAREDGGGVYQQMVARGLGKLVRTAFDAVVPLYLDGSHVGMGFSDGARLCTVGDPDAGVVTAGGRGGPPLVFEESASGFLGAPLGQVSVGTPAVVRSPGYGEQVFVVGVDSETPYCAMVDAQVEQVGVGSRSFRLGSSESAGADLPVSGGLVVSKVDGAVLGVVDKLVHVTVGGCVALCRAYPVLVKQSVVETAEASLARVFPFLRPGSWASGHAAAALEAPAGSGRAGLTQAALAAVGCSAADTVCAVKVVEGGREPTSVAVDWQQVYAGASGGLVVDSLGFRELVQRFQGGGVVAAEDASAALLAVAGCVFINEDVASFERFCEVVSLFSVEAG